MSQKVDVIEYLRRHGSITRREAMIELGVMELSSRIGELEREGFRIPRSDIHVLARNGRRTKVTQYRAPTVWP